MFRSLVTALAVGGAVCAAGAASAATTVFTFVGKCADCDGFVRGELVLDDFVTGHATAANFVSFSYEGSNLAAPFTILAADLKTFDATLDTESLGIASDVAIDQVGATGWFFTSTAEGYWELGQHIPVSPPPPPPPPPPSGGHHEEEDLGFANSWVAKSPTISDPGLPIAVPEPSAWALMILGVFGVGGVLRRNARTARALSVARRP